MQKQPFCIIVALKVSKRGFKMQFKDGDLITALINGEVDAIAHCCNAQGVMGSGLAKQIRERLPEAYDAYKAAPMTLGTNVIADVVGGERKVVNMIAQEFYGRGKRQVHYGALAKCLLNAPLACKKLLLQDGLNYGDSRIQNFKLGVPYKLASDLAGGDWNVVLELLEAVEMSGSVEVVVYKKGV